MTRTVTTGADAIRAARAVTTRTVILKTVGATTATHKTVMTARAKGDVVVVEAVVDVAEGVRVFREELALDKTRTQVYDIGDLGLVEMTRKRIGEGLLESVSTGCFTCESNGLLFDDTLFGHRQAIPGPSVSQVTNPK